MTEEGFKKAIKFLESAFREELTQDQRDAYWLILKSERDEDIQRGVIEYARSERARFGFPKPGDLISQDDSLLAWQKVLEAISSVGTWQSVDFGDRTIHAVLVSIGGWIELGMTEDKDLKWKQKEFERLYLAYRSRGITGPDHVIGRIEHQNGVEGYEIPKPVLLGAKPTSDQKEIAHQEKD